MLLLHTIMIPSLATNFTLILPITTFFEYVANSKICLYLQNTINLVSQDNKTHSFVLLLVTKKFKRTDIFFFYYILQNVTIFPEMVCVHIYVRQQWLIILECLVTFED